MVTWALVVMFLGQPPMVMPGEYPNREFCVGAGELLTSNDATNATEDAEHKTTWWCVPRTNWDGVDPTNVPTPEPKTDG